jgi:hypothetical protein
MFEELHPEIKYLLIINKTLANSILVKYFETFDQQFKNSGCILIYSNIGNNFFSYSDQLNIQLLHN